MGVLSPAAMSTFCMGDDAGMMVTFYEALGLLYIYLGVYFGFGLCYRFIWVLLPLFSRGDT